MYECMFQTALIPHWSVHHLSKINYNWAPPEPHQPTLSSFLKLGTHPHLIFCSVLRHRFSCSTQSMCGIVRVLWWSFTLQWIQDKLCSLCSQTVPIGWVLQHHLLLWFTQSPTAHIVCMSCVCLWEEHSSFPQWFPFHSSHADRLPPSHTVWVPHVGADLAQCCDACTCSFHSSHMCYMHTCIVPVSRNSSYHVCT